MELSKANDQEQVQGLLVALSAQALLNDLVHPLGLERLKGRLLSSVQVPLSDLAHHRDLVLLRELALPIVLAKIALGATP